MSRRTSSPPLFRGFNESSPRFGRLRSRNWGVRGCPRRARMPGRLANDAGNYHEAARLFGAAEAVRKRIGLFRFVIHQAVYKASVAALRDAMGEEDFDAAWAEGAALSPRTRSPTRRAAAANAKRRAFRLLHALALEAEARGHSVRLPKRNMHGYVAASRLGGNMIVQVGEIQCSMVIWQPKDRVPHTPTPTSTIRIESATRPP